MRGHFEEYNNQFNQHFTIFVDQMLSPERVGDSGYVPIGQFKKTETEFSPYPDFISDEIQNELLPSDDLSDSERVVLSNLIFGEKTNYVLAGAMGSGKSALMNFLSDFTKTKINDRVFAISINFHEGFPSESTIEETMSLFKNILAKNMEFTLQQILNDEDLIDELIKLWESDSASYIYNNSFLKKTRENKWKNKLSYQKTDSLFSYIEEQNELIEGKLYSLFEVLKTIKFLLLNRNKHLILFFDNIDRLLPLAQLKILDDIIAKNEISQVKTLIALRRSSYKRFSRNADFDYGYFHHQGPFPVRVIRKRLLFWKETINQHDLTKNLEEKYKNALLSRIDFILNDIRKGDRSYTRKFLHCLSGRSVRVGLDLSHRIFINNIFPYDDPSHYDNHIAKGILLGVNNDISPNDPLIVNVFQLPDFNVLSILQIRILQLIIAFRSRPHLLKFRHIMKVLKKIGYDDDDEIRTSINKMLDKQRPLFWLDTIGRFESNDELYLCDEIINLSESGYNYYKYLLVDLNYVQECFNSIDWEDESIPDKYENKLYERFSYLRKCLTIIHRIDHSQIHKYVEFNKTNKIENEISNIELFSNRIIYHIVRYFLNITKDHELKSHQQFYYLDWQSLLNDCYRNSYSSKCRKGISSALKDIENRILD